MQKKIISAVSFAALFASVAAMADTQSLMPNPEALAKIQTIATCSGNANDNTNSDDDNNANNDTCTGNCCGTCCGGCCGGCSGDENCSGNSGPAGSK